MRHDKLARNVGELLQSGEYSDLTVVCGSRQWNVHRTIVCPQSSFFAAACKGNIQESHTRKITLEGDDPATVDRMFNWLYTAEYDVDDPGQTPQDIKAMLLAHAAVYVLADKYGIRDLAYLASTMCLGSGKIETVWQDGTFVDVVREILLLLPLSDRDLLPGLVDVWARNIRNIPELELASAYEASFGARGKCEESFDKWQQLLVSNPEFTTGLLRKVVSYSAAVEGMSRVRYKELRKMISDYKLAGEMSDDVASELLDQVFYMSAEPPDTGLKTAL